MARQTAKYQLTDEQRAAGKHFLDMEKRTLRHIGGAEYYQVMNDEIKAAKAFRALFEEGGYGEVEKNLALREIRRELGRAVAPIELEDDDVA
jgi:hypothetical protein